MAASGSVFEQDGVNSAIVSERETQIPFLNQPSHRLST